MSPRPSGLALTMTLDAPDGVVSEGTTLAVAVRATATHEVRIQRAAIELVRTLTYAYRRGNLHGAVSTGIEHTVAIVDHSPMAVAATLAEGESLETEAKLTLPASGPGTTQGKLIQIQWAVRARFALENAPDTVREEVIEVRSLAKQCAADADEPALDETRGDVTMSFEELSSRTILPGILLFGSLRIGVLKPVSARAVRVELVLQEEIEHGPGAAADPTRGAFEDDKEAQTVVVRSVVPCQALHPGQQLTVPFSLDVPSPLPAPSLRIPNLRIRWAVRGVVDVPFRLDPQLTLPLLGITTLP